MEFKKKTCIVSGGGSGIGRAVALHMASLGARVVIGDVDQKMTEETLAYIRKKGGKASAFIGDMSKKRAVKALVEKALSRFGRIDYVCNSVGLQTYGTVETTSEKVWDQTMDANLKPMFLVSKYCIPEIRKQGGGAIVHISSIQGLRCQENVSAYAASKGAVIALTRTMGLDYAKENIRVNCICPGSIDTPLLRFGAAAHGPVEEVLQDWGKHHPIGRIGTAEEIAKVVSFLFKEEAAFIVGQAIVADGGLGSRIL